MAKHIIGWAAVAISTVYNGAVYAKTKNVGQDSIGFRAVKSADK